MQAPGSGPRLRLAGPLPACGLRDPVRGLSMFQAPGLGAGGAWQQAGGVGLARRLPLGDSTEASVPAKSTAQQSPFLHSLCNTQLGQGSCSVLGHGNRRDPASSSGRGGRAGGRASLQDRPVLCVPARPAATESAAGRLQTTEVPCLPGLQAGRPGPGCCGAVCSVGSLPAPPSPGGRRQAWRSLDGPRPPPRDTRGVGSGPTLFRRDLTLPDYICSEQAAFPGPGGQGFDLPFIERDRI